MSEETSKHPVSSSVERILNGSISGLLLLRSRPGTPSGANREFRTFTDVDIIIAASNWTITGEAMTSLGERRSYVVRVREDTNVVDISLGSLRWRTSWPGNEIEVVNDAPNDRLTLAVDRPFFSSNDQAWFLDLPSVFHVEKI